MRNITGLASELTKRDLAYLVFKRKHQILGVFAATFVLVTIGAYLTPRTYRATATVYVVRNLPPIAATGPSSLNVILDRKEVLNSEVDLITSRAVAEKVADILEPPDRPAREPKQPPAFVRGVRAARDGVRGFFMALGLADPPPGPREGLVSSLQQIVRAEPALNSNFITISVDAESPAFAARAVNAFTKVYLDQRLVLLKRPGLEKFYDEQIQRAREAMERLDGEAAELKVRTGVVSADEQLRLKLEELSGLTVELNQVRSEKLELKERIAALRQRVDDQPASVVSTRLVQRNPNVSDLEKKRMDLAAERALELNRFHPDSAPIQEIDRSIARIEEVLAQEPVTIVNSESVAQNSVRTTLLTDLYRTESDYSAKEAREQALAAQLNAVRANVQRLDQGATALRRLSEASASASKVYATYVSQREEARIATETDPGVTNVQVVSHATVPSRPTYPRILQIMLGAVLGLFLGCALAFVSELFGQTLDRRDDVERELGLPLLASVPDFGTLQRIP